MQIEDVAVPLLHLLQQRGGRRAVEVDARDRRLGAFEDHVLGFLDVDLAAAQVIEDVGQHAGTIAVADDEHVRRRRFLRQVHDVGHLAGVLVAADDAHRLGGDRFLRLIGRRADVMRAVDVLQRDDRIRELAGRGRRLRREHVEADANVALANRPRERRVVDDFAARGVDEVGARLQPVEHRGVDEPLRLRR